MQTNHIAVLTRNLDVASDSLPAFCKRLPIEDQPTEGTREQYIEIDGEDAPALLLIQPIAEGPYSRALNKRGPGLHHIGCITSAITDVLAVCHTHRLLLHPKSLTTYPKNVIWLCRPGVPFLVEVMLNTSIEPTIKKCSLHLPSKNPVPDHVRSLFSNLELHNVDDGLLHIEMGDRKITLEDLG